MSTNISALANRPVIIGGGAAGLMTALQLAPEPVLIVSKRPSVRGCELTPWPSIRIIPRGERLLACTYDQLL